MNNISSLGDVRSSETLSCELVAATRVSSVACISCARDTSHDSRLLTSRCVWRARTRISATERAASTRRLASRPERSDDSSQSFADSSRRRYGLRVRDRSPVVSRRFTREISRTSCESFPFTDRRVDCRDARDGDGDVGERRHAARRSIAEAAADAARRRRRRGTSIPTIDTRECSSLFPQRTVVCMKSTFLTRDSGFSRAYTSRLAILPPVASSAKGE